MSQKVWTRQEILHMWPQAEGELLGFQSALQANGSGITAAQLGMALQLAKIEFEKIQNQQPEPYTPTR